MKRLITFLAIAVAFTIAAADRVTEVFTLDHQMHSGCKTKIISNLRFEKGVSKIDVSLPDNTITIVYNPEKTDSPTLIGAFKKIGFNAVSINDNNNMKDNPAKEQ